MKNIPKPETNREEALIKVKLAGICSTDLEIASGYMDFEGTPGHEFVGVVEDSSAGELKGKRVVGEINAGCGDCRECRENASRHCPERTVLGMESRDGAFAEYLTLPEDNLHRVPDSIPDKRAVFTEPVAAALRIPEQFDLEQSETVPVIGDGKLGLLIAQVVDNYSNCILCYKHRKKAQKVADLGVDILPTEKLSGKFPLIVEVSGNPEGLKAALKHLEPGGTLILKSTYTGSFDFNPSDIVVNELNISGSRCGPFPEALNWLREDKIEVERMISKIYDFDDIIRALDYAKRSGSLKVIIKMD